MEQQNKITDLYKLAMDQWQRMTRALQDRNFDDMEEAAVHMAMHLDDMIIAIDDVCHVAPVDRKLWAEFSEVQQAGWLIPDRESMERFKVWLTTGRDDDAWGHK